VAYSADIKALPEQSLAQMAGLDVWIVDALRHAPHPSHMNLDETLGWIARVKPKRAVLTNLHAELDYEALREQLPSNIEPAFDGMQFENG
jgi:phosphoribosyl 1,2-cyclic phosphate phosphodiesterase